MHSCQHCNHSHHVAMLLTWYLHHHSTAVKAVDRCSRHCVTSSIAVAHAPSATSGIPHLHNAPITTLCTRTLSPMQRTWHSTGHPPLQSRLTSRNLLQWGCPGCDYCVTTRICSAGCHQTFLPVAAAAVVSSACTTRPLQPLLPARLRLQGSKGLWHMITAQGMSGKFW